MTIRTAADNKSTILQVAGVDKLKINDTGVVEADYFKTPAGVLSPVGSFRNKIINGDLSIWQRDTSQGSGVSGLRSADRWHFVNSGNGIRTVSRVLLSEGSPARESEASYAAQISISTAPSTAASYIYMSQKVESVFTLQGKTVTVSFWGASSVNNDVSVELVQQFGTGGTPSAFVSIPVGRVTLKPSMARYSVTAELPSLAGKVLGTNGDDSVYLNIWQSAGSNYADRTFGLGHQTGDFLITGVQLEEGPYATPFEQRPIGLELALCQRYFEKSYDLNEAPGGTSRMYGATHRYRLGVALDPGVTFKVTKRVNPTVQLFSPNTGVISRVYNFTQNTDTNVGAIAYSGEAGFTPNIAGGGGVAANDFLIYQWTADAEI